jgi:hypothetical protein
VADSRHSSLLPDNDSPQPHGGLAFVFKNDSLS